MPRETYLPAGMGGVISCPVRAEPPVLFVNWTKDGDILDLNKVSEIAEGTSPQNDLSEIYIYFSFMEKLISPFLLFSSLVGW